VTPERQELIERIFLEAVELDRASVAAHLDRSCGDDQELRREVESLLGYSSRAEKFLDHQELVELTPALVRPLDETLVAGTMVGEYRIERILGTGGMGVVYIATQDRPRRTVALKLVNALIASPSVRRRFELEAEVLGRLQHPGIAQVFEAGAAHVGGGGEVRRPFIAMELVDGPPITEHCESQALGTHDRMRLLIKICQAVQHAHQRGVIHRDLKPANILVTADGQPKILDFGVARATDVGHHLTTIATGIGQIIGTLSYMSPEQVLGNPRDIDTRTDVYSLGVILFELLAKRLPLDVSGRSLPEAVRAIRQDDPTRLSSVSRIFRGDLDTIASKALEKDKSRRYQSAAELGEDLQRFLDGRPIFAKDDSAFYVLRKQLRRYRGAVVVASSILVALVGFAIYAANQARVQRRLAELERSARVEADNARDMASARAAELRKSLYVSAIGFAQAAYGAHDTLRMRRVLETCPEDLRGWEWRLLRAASDTSATAVPLPAVDWRTAISTDGKSFALMTAGNPPKIMDTASGVCIASLKANDSYDLGACFSEDGETLVLGDLHGRLRIACLRTCEERFLPVNDQMFVRPLAMVPRLGAVAMQFAVAPGEDEVRLISLEDGSTLSRLGTGNLNNIAVSPDGGLVAIGGFDGEVWVAPSDGSRERVELFRHESVVRGLAFSPDGKTLASASADGSVALIPLDGSGANRYQIFDNKATALAWRPDGRFLAVGGTEGVIQILDPADGAIVSTLMGHGGWTRMLAWNLENDTLISVSGDHSIRTWRTPEVPHQPRYTSNKGFGAGAWSLSGDRVFLGDLVGRIVSLRARDLGDRRVLADLGQYVTEIELSPDGGLLAASAENGRIAVIDLASEKIVAQWRSPANRAIDLDFDPTGTRLLLGSDTPGMTIWEARTGRLLTHVKSFPSAVIRGDWSTDGTLIAAAYYDNVVRLHDAADGRVVRELYGPNLWIAEVRFVEHDAKVMASSDDGNVYVWDVAQGGKPRIVAAQVRGVYGLSLSPDGKRLATGGFDNTFRVVDFETGEELLMFRRHSGAVWVAEFSPDGSRILSAASDGSAVIWGAPLESGEREAAERIGPVVKAH
jgi:WD40 repeat protein/serine/threonine protein kinase